MPALEIRPESMTPALRASSLTTGATAFPHHRKIGAEMPAIRMTMRKRLPSHT